MTVLVLVMLFVCIGIPLGYAWRIYSLDEPSLSAWALGSSRLYRLPGSELMPG